MTIRQFHKQTAARLTAVLGSSGEGEAAARIIFEDVGGYSPTFIFANGDREITDFTAGKIDAVVGRVESGEPVQYAVGHALFMGNDYLVGRGVLIPRPETAGLVDIITDDCGGRSGLRVLDVGTGSGCIAISLCRALPFSSVTACDISDEALDVARQNAERLKAAVDFRKCDILKSAPTSAPQFDIIVSNPPYICRSEAADMDHRVTDYEPASALFVPDDDPLLFYRAIARYAAGALCPGGRLYFEINSRFPEDMRRLLEECGFDHIDIRRDYKGNYRYACATL